MKMAEELASLTHCCVCSFRYTLEGEHVPKILNCTCSLCSMCIDRKLKKSQPNYFDCPQCGAYTACPGGSDSFNDNTYIRIYLKSLEKEVLQLQQQQPTQIAKPYCIPHEREISLYCENCQDFLCIVCSRNQHQQCDIFGLYEEKLTENLEEKIKGMKKILVERKELLTKEKDYNVRRSDRCIEDIIFDRDRIIQEIVSNSQNMVDIVLKLQTRVDTNIKTCIMETEGCIEKIEDLERNVNSTSTMDMIAVIKGTSVYTAPCEINHDYFEYSKSDVSVHKILGNLQQRKTDSGLKLYNYLFGLNAPILADHNFDKK